MTRFQGTVQECLRQYAKLIPVPPGSKDRNRYYEPLAMFCDVLPTTVATWLNLEKQTVPGGIPFLRAAFFFQLIGGKVVELRRVQRDFKLGYRLAELLGMNCLELDALTQRIGYSNAKDVLRLTRNEGGCTPERSKTAWAVVNSLEAEVVTKRNSQGLHLRAQILGLFGPETAEPVEPERAKVEPPVATQVEDPSPEPAPPLADTAAPPTTATTAPAPIESTPQFNILPLAGMLIGIVPLCREALVNLDAEGRRSLRKASTNGKTCSLYEVADLLNQLCREPINSK